MHLHVFSVYIYDLFLKLVRSNINYRLLRRRRQRLNIVFFSLHLLPRINVLLGFICMRPDKLQGTQSKRKLQKETFLSTV